MTNPRATLEALKDDLGKTIQHGDLKDQGKLAGGVLMIFIPGPKFADKIGKFRSLAKVGGESAELAEKVADKLADASRAHPRLVLVEAGTGKITDLGDATKYSQEAVDAAKRRLDNVVAIGETGRYGDLKRKSSAGMQANHLNQNAAFRDIIPEADGVAVAMLGDAITGFGTPHFKFHQSLERFWEPYRKGQALFGKTPTNAQYGQALKQALRDAGISADEAERLAAEAAEHRRAYGLQEADFVPRIPGRLNQPKPKG